jgi:hypothetical protein
MIAIGTILIAAGVAFLLDLNFWPTLLIGLGAGFTLSGLAGKFGWVPTQGRRGHGRASKQQSQDDRFIAGDEPA